MTTFITKVDRGTGEVRLAVKDLIDVEGVPTTAASRAVASRAAPALRDAACVRSAILSGARVVGKANLHELGFGATGVNAAYGTPVNPRDADLIPGGSSSGSAVAVAGGEADIALGTDTAGSVRIPAACCGVAGLKTTFGRIPLDGVMALTSTLDTVGPLGPDVAAVSLCMQMVETGFAPRTGARRIGRFRFTPTEAWIDALVDDALARSGAEVVDVDLPGWMDAWSAAATLLLAESHRVAGGLLTRVPDLLGEDVRTRLAGAAHVTEEQLEQARRTRRAWSQELGAVLDVVDVIATPTIGVAVPRLDGDLARAELDLSLLTMPVNLAGLPAFAQPLTGGDRLASLQLIGPRYGDDLVTATAGEIEAALR